MKGLELSELFYEQIGRPAILNCPEAVKGGWAAGLVGEGSECFGFDDALSRDHDWGPGFCIWLTNEQFEAYGHILQQIYNRLPIFFGGYTRIETTMAGQRVGVFRITDFYGRFLGPYVRPKNNDEWMCLPENYLAVAVNGCIFEDSTGCFSEIRDNLLSFYPEDVRRKKLAARLAVMAREGQYNYPRCMQRQDIVAAGLALARFTEAAMSAVYLLNRQYMPYYKWAWKGLEKFQDGRQCQMLLRELTQSPSLALIEQIAHWMRNCLEAQGLSKSKDDFLHLQALEVQAGISDSGLRQRHLLEG